MRTAFEKLVNVSLAAGFVLALAISPVGFVSGGACRAGEPPLDPAALSELADGFRRHCVRVFVYAKSHEGKSPEVGDFAADIANERSTPLGGYWWDERHVVVEDPVLQDQFIDSVEISPPFSNVRYAARIAGRFARLPALLLEVLPDENGLLPRASPLEFADRREGERMVLSYGWEKGEWIVSLGDLVGGVGVTDSGLALISFGTGGIVVGKDGVPLGLAFGETSAIMGDGYFRQGSGVRATPLLSTGEVGAFNLELGGKLTDCVLQTRFRLRVKIDEDDDGDSWLDGDELGADVGEVRATGVAVGRRHLLVPLALGAEAISRIEDIGVLLADGRRIDAEYAGAFREYRAVLVETARDLEFDELPPGFSLLNPMVIPSEAFEIRDAANPSIQEYFHRWRVDHELGRRREKVDYDRWLGVFRGYRDDVVVQTRTNEEEGSLAFDSAGRLVAMALTPRVARGGDGDGGARRAGAGFRPIDFLHGRFQSSDVFDPGLVPVDEDQGRRLIDFGVEYQGLDGNTSRLFHAAEETRGGAIGMLVTHVYPGFAAERLGIRAHDVLLRLFMAGEREPVELKADDYGGSVDFDFDDLSGESVRRAFSFMSPPWPARENSLSRLLTSAGVGRRVVVEYLREGEVRRGEFVSEYGVPDYRNAPKRKFDRLGATVKPVTYEVARYFGRPEESGVVVSRVEDGGKGSVAGLHAYLFVTRVDGRRVAGVNDFAEAMDLFEKGAAPAVELMVEVFGKTKLVKIERGD